MLYTIGMSEATLPKGEEALSWNQPPICVLAHILCGMYDLRAVAHRPGSVPLIGKWPSRMPVKLQDRCKCSLSGTSEAMSALSTFSVRAEGGGLYVFSLVWIGSLEVAAWVQIPQPSIQATKGYFIYLIDLSRKHLLQPNLQF